MEATKPVTNTTTLPEPEVVVTPTDIEATYVIDESPSVPDTPSMPEDTSALKSIEHPVIPIKNKPTEVAPWTKRNNGRHKVKRISPPCRINHSHKR